MAVQDNFYRRKREICPVTLQLKSAVWRNKWKQGFGETKILVHSHVECEWMPPNLYISEWPFQYPEARIRIAFLDLLLCLAKNSKDVVKFLVDHHFNMTLLGKVIWNFGQTFFQLSRYLSKYIGKCSQDSIMNQ